MEWICEQEGIEADAEALAVLAQAGEGSVRDSLSALDQAIACCGTTLSADRDARSCSACSRSNRSTRWPRRSSGDPAGCSTSCRNSSATATTCSTSAASWPATSATCWWRRSPAEPTRLIAASPRSRNRWLQIAARFSEEDLTRYLQLTLELFKDLQTSLQPRLHLEIGLLRLVHAGKMVPIEEALAAGRRRHRRSPTARPPHGRRLTIRRPLRPRQLRAGPDLLLSSATPPKGTAARPRACAEPCPNRNRPSPLSTTPPAPIGDARLHRGPGRSEVPAHRRCGRAFDGRVHRHRSHLHHQPVVRDGDQDRSRA